MKISWVSSLIELEIINPYRPLRVNLNIDEQSTKSNGYYNLKDGIIEELKNNDVVKLEMVNLKIMLP